MVVQVLIIFRNFAKLDSSIKTRRLLTRESILRKVAGQGLLVKLGSFSTDKAVLVHALNNSIIVIHWVADVENLACIINISIISVSSILLVTVKTIIIRSIKKISSTCRETLNSIWINLILIIVLTVD